MNYERWRSAKKVGLPARDAELLAQRHSAAIRALRADGAMSDDKRWSLLYLVVAPSPEIMRAQLLVEDRDATARDEDRFQQPPLPVGGERAAA